MNGRVVKELQSRFDHFLKTGDDSKIPNDLTGVIFRIVSASAHLYAYIQYSVRPIRRCGKADGPSGRPPGALRPSPRTPSKAFLP